MSNPPRPVMSRTPATHNTRNITVVPDRNVSRSTQNNTVALDRNVSHSTQNNTVVLDRTAPRSIQNKAVVLDRNVSRSSRNDVVESDRSHTVTRSTHSTVSNRSNPGSQHDDIFDDRPSHFKSFFICPWVAMTVEKRRAHARDWVYTQIPRILNEGPEVATAAQQSRKLNARTHIVIPVGLESCPFPKRKPSIAVRLVSADTLNVARYLRLQNQKDRIGVLNMASGRLRGGKLLDGTIAQEESLTIKTTLWASMRPEFYPPKGSAWEDQELVYAPNVKVIRRTPDTLLDPHERYFIDVIAVEGVKRPPIKDGRFARTSDELNLRMKIRNILYVAIQYRMKHLVLGALGCGVYRNPPSMVATIMMEELQGFDWQTYGLQQVIIAIRDSSPDLNVWSPFCQIFDTMSRACVDRDRQYAFNMVVKLLENDIPRLDSMPEDDDPPLFEEPSKDRLRFVGKDSSHPTQTMKTNDTRTQPVPLANFTIKGKGKTQKEKKNQEKVHHENRDHPPKVSSAVSDPRPKPVSSSEWAKLGAKVRTLPTAIDPEEIETSSEPPVLPKVDAPKQSDEPKLPYVTNMKLW